MHRDHRRELKHDRFVDEVGSLTSRARDNQRLLVTIAAAAVVLAVAVYGIFFYRSAQERKAQKELATAIETVESPLVTPGAPQPDPKARFKTDAERNAAAEKQFKDLVTHYGSSDAADVAKVFLARISSGRGDTATARRLLQEFISDHPNHLLVGGARYSLYQMRIDGGEAQQVITELNTEIGKTEGQPLPTDSLLVLLAHAYEVQGNEQKSRDTYKRIVTEFPDSPFALEAQRRVGPA